MIQDNNTAQTLANYLLQINAIKLNLQTPYTWASGWKSPIYCDNRLSLSYPLIRTYIKQAFANIVKNNYDQSIVLAGVATAGIPHGCLLADELNLPFIYVRSAPKGHGLSNQIEGKLSQNDKVIVVEDLISTGASSLEAVQAIRNAGAEVIGLLAIFTYGFDIANQAFLNAKVPFQTLTDYNTLIEVALKNGIVNNEELASLSAWRSSPASWSK
jgi:orotate phosphoribosyltransferase